MAGGALLGLAVQAAFEAREDVAGSEGDDGDKGQRFSGPVCSDDPVGGDDQWKETHA